MAKTKKKLEAEIIAASVKLEGQADKLAKLAQTAATFDEMLSIDLQGIEATLRQLSADLWQPNGQRAANGSPNGEDV